MAVPGFVGYLWLWCGIYDVFASFSSFRCTVNLVFLESTKYVTNTLQQRRSKEDEKKSDKKEHDREQSSVKIVNRTSSQSTAWSRDSMKPGINLWFETCRIDVKYLTVL